MSAVDAPCDRRGRAITAKGERAATADADALGALLNLSRRPGRSKRRRRPAAAPRGF
jgi:hypothetical protein